MFTKENIRSLLSVYTGKVRYKKQDGQDREYYLTNHPLSNKREMYKPEHPEKVVLWCINEHKWRYLRPEGVSNIQTEWGI